MKREKAKKLVNAFLGKQSLGEEWNDTFLNGEKLAGKPLSEMILDLKSLSEEQWGLYAFSREPLEGKFTRQQKIEYTKRAAACGREEAKMLLEKLGSRNGRAAAASLGFKVSTPDMPNGGGHVIFAQYEEPDQITIFMDGISKAEMMMKEEAVAEVLEHQDLFELLLAHELFHGIEYQKRDIIYTQIEKIELWRKPFSNRSRIIALGEIAAMAFAGQWMGISWMPYVLDVALMWCYEPKAAEALYREIMELCYSEE